MIYRFSQSRTFHLVVLSAFVLLAGSLVFSQSPSTSGFVDARLISVPRVKLPKEAKGADLGGRVTVKVAIDERGRVTSVDEILGPGWICPSAKTPGVVALRDTAKAAALKAKFKPATRDGVAVTSSMDLDFDFSEPVNKESGSGALRLLRVDDPAGSNVAGTEPASTGVRLASKDDADASEVVTMRGREQNLKAASGTLPKTVSGGVLNGKAKSLPRPSYPPAARAVRAAGPVNVQVLILEDGTVFSAVPVNGHPLLQSASRMAACSAEFYPVLLSGNPVKVSGVITYNYVP